MLNEENIVKEYRNMVSRYYDFLYYYIAGNHGKEYFKESLVSVVNEKRNGLLGQLDLMQAVGIPLDYPEEENKIIETFDSYELFGIGMNENHLFGGAYTEEEIKEVYEEGGIVVDGLRIKDRKTYKEEEERRRKIKELKMRPRIK